MTAEHNHERMEVPTVGLDDGMKKKVAHLYGEGGLTVKNISRRLEVYDPEERKKIATFLNNHRKKILDLKVKSRLSRDE